MKRSKALGGERAAREPASAEFWGLNPPCFGALLGVLALGTIACHSAGNKTTAASCPVGFENLKDRPEACVAIRPAEACPAGTMARLGQRACVPVGNSVCADGFVPAADGWGCEAILPPEACPVGTMARVGETRCQAVGQGGCVFPFVPDASGWACTDQLPATPCTGATRSGLDGQCVPLGDCNAPFPPAGADYVVDASFTAPQLDATHFKTIRDALLVARSGDLVAVAAGTYNEDLAPYGGVAVQGQCAEQVILGPLMGSTQPGLLAFKGKASFSKMTVTGHLVGAASVTKGEMILDEVLLEKNMDIGALVTDQGSSMTLRHSVIRGTLATDPKAWGFGVNAESGGLVVLEQSEVVDNIGAGLFGRGSGTLFQVSGSAIWRTHGFAQGTQGHGVHAERGAKVELISSSVALNHSIGVYGWGEGSRVSVQQSVIRDTLQNAQGAFGIGVQVDTRASLLLFHASILRSATIGVFSFDPGASVEINFSSLVENPVHGSVNASAGPRRSLMIQQGPEATVLDTAIIDGAEAAVVVGGRGASLTMERSLIAGTRVDPRGEQGLGLWLADGGVATVRDSQLRDNKTRGLLAQDPGSAAILEGVLIEGTTLAGSNARDGLGRWPFGLDSADGGAVDASRCVLRRNQHLNLRVTRTETGGSPARASFVDGVISEGLADKDLGFIGLGALVQFDSSLRIERSSLRGNTTAGVVADSATAQLQLVDCDLVGTHTIPGEALGYSGVGVAIQLGANGSLEGLAAFGNDGYGLFVAGLGSHATVSETLLAGEPTLSKGRQRGPGMAVQDGASATFEGLEVRDTNTFSVGVGYQDATIYLDQALIHDTQFDSQGEFADGVLVTTGGRATLSRLAVYNNPRVGLVFSKGTARMSWVEVSRNEVGIHAQEGSVIVPVEEVSDQYSPLKVEVGDNCPFLDNLSRVGRGTVPIPDRTAPVHIP